MSSFPAYDHTQNGACKRHSRCAVRQTPLPRYMLSFRRLGQRASLATTKKYLDRQEHLQPRGTKSHKARPRGGANHHKGDRHPCVGFSAQTGPAPLRSRACLVTAFRQRGTRCQSPAASEPHSRQGDVK